MKDETPREVRSIRDPQGKYETRESSLWWIATSHVIGDAHCTIKD